MKLRFFAFLAVVLAVLLVSGQALAEKRVALVIGNGAYGRSIGALANPPNDARLMAKTLRQLGFDVVEGIDVDQKAMKRAISSFGKKLTKAGNDAVGLFYYAGHGVQVNGTNYLIPLNVNIETEADVDIEAVAANGVQAQMAFAGNRLNIIVMDACRNNPFKRGFRSASRGLAKMEATKGTLIAYATAPGSVAADGSGSNSPYTEALSKAMLTPGLTVERVFKQVRNDVVTATKEQQIPWESSSLTGADFYFKGGAAAAEAAAKKPGMSDEAMFWNSIKDSTNPAMFEEYLRKFPDGQFSGLAGIKLDELKAKQVVLAVPPKPAFAVDEMDATYVALRNANVRSEPSAQSEKRGTLKQGGEVQVTGKAGTWYRVEYQGTSAYVFAKLLGEQQAALSAPASPKPPPQGQGSAPPPPPAATKAPSQVLLPSGLRLSDWVMLAEDRLERGEFRTVMVEGAAHRRKYGSAPGIDGVVERAVTGLLKDAKVGNAAGAQDALRVVSRIKGVVGDGAALASIESRALHRLGRFDQAVSAYKRWLSLAPGDARDRREMLAYLMRAQRRQSLGPSTRQTFRDCEDAKLVMAGSSPAPGAFCGPEMVVIPAGSFRMGDQRGGGEVTERPVRTVNIPISFAVGKYEVTFAQWDDCVSAGGCFHRPKDRGWGRGNRPAINVSWDDAKEYVRWLSGKTGKQYHLLSEAEWEYAVRAGTSTKWSCGSNESCVGSVAWYTGNSGNKTHPVGGKSANGFGVHDMYGNAWEWVEDCLHNSYNGAPRDGNAWTTGGDCSRRVLRGGSWDSYPRNMRSATRNWNPSGVRYNYIGFRVSRTLP